MRRRTVALITGALAFALLAWGVPKWQAVAGGAARLKELSRYDWAALPEGAGGLSGLEMSGDGRRWTAISDAGFVAQGHVKREQGRIADWMLDGGFRRLRAPDGNPHPNGGLDAEGLAQRADGSWVVSMEGQTRFLVYPRWAVSAPGDLPVNGDLPKWTRNHGLEALAESADGCLIALLERPQDGQFPIYRFCGTRWALVARLNQSGPFVPVGADVAPDGRLYLLERHFNGVAFRSQIRRLDLRQPQAGAEVLMTSPSWAYDNLEGLSVWTDGTGMLRLTAISDDNFFALQKTQIVEFALIE